MTCCQLARFIKDESAAVTVDWTVITAACVGMGLSAVAAVRAGVIPIGQTLTDASVVALNFSGEQAEPYTPYHLRPEQIDFYVGYYSDPLQSGSDADLLALRLDWASTLEAAIRAGDRDAANRHMDAVYTVDEGLSARGQALPDGERTIDEFRELYAMAFG